MDRERKRRNIPKLQVEQPLSEALLAKLGTDRDRAIGLKHRVHYSKVRELRLKRQIPASSRTSAAKPVPASEPRESSASRER